ncbi:eukaryotic type KH-domain (KH-domain type I) [Daldinia grandis]|nr:eukaryotic type KH-domain (KH-domain type I) [Daldinia grandis]
MPAPTALLKQVDDTPPSNLPLPEPDQDEDFTLEGMNELPEDANAILQPARITGEDGMEIDEEDKPHFAPVQNTDPAAHIQTRKVGIPPHRFTPLKSAWPKIYPPLVEHLKLQVRMNVKHKRVELRTSRHTTDAGALQKGEDFVRAFALGFDVDDAIALLRLDDLYIETFEVKDVKTLNGDHLARAIGRIAGKDGKTKFAIENVSRTRVVLADSKIHILGGFKNIHIARESIVSLILGKPPGKVYNNLRTVSARMKERF